jgi:hypothetical protein
MTAARGFSIHGLLPSLYLVVGLLVAGGHHYFVHLDSGKQVGSAILAVLLWPLLLFGVHLHIT